MAQQSTKIDLQGWGDLEKALRQLGPSVARKVGAKAMSEAGKIIADEAKVFVPVDTGELEDSITVVSVRSNLAQVLKASVGFKRTAAWRAHFIEYGTRKMAAQPFMRPALDAKGPAAIERMGQVMWDGIAREAARAPKGKN